MDYPFDTETTAYAYVTARTSQGGYGHIALYMRLPSLARDYPMDSVTLTLRAQCSGGDPARTPDGFYAIRLHADQFTDGIDVANLDRTYKTVRSLQRALAKLDAAVGAPAVLIDDLMMRYIRAAKIAHVYVEPRESSGQGIPNWPAYEPANPDSRDSLRSAIGYAKRGLAQRVGVNLTPV